jgi:hypothetical protein
MVIHDYDFTKILMARFNNTLTTVVDAEPTHNLVFHLGKSSSTTVLQGDEHHEYGKIHVDIPNVTRENMWTNTIKKQLKLMFQIAQLYSVDYMSVVLYGTAQTKEAAIAIHQTLRELTGTMYMIEFCAPDIMTRSIYEQTLNRIYRS